MKLALLLPAFVPDLRWLAAASQADLVVLDDITPWSRKSRVHRYQMRTPQGIQWLNLPVQKSDAPLHETRLRTDEDWAGIHLRTLAMNYRNSLYFDFYEQEIEALFDRLSKKELLLDVCLEATAFWLRLLYSEIDLRLASATPEWSPDPDEMASRVGAIHLLLEHESRHYQRQPSSTPVIGLPHPHYRQHFGGFFEGCGVLDYIFSCGPDGEKI